MQEGLIACPRQTDARDARHRAGGPCQPRPDRPAQHLVPKPRPAQAILIPTRLLQRAGQADHARVKLLDVVPDLLHCVAVGIHGDEHCRDLLARGFLCIGAWVRGAGVCEGVQARACTFVPEEGQERAFSAPNPGRRDGWAGSPWQPPCTVHGHTPSPPPPAQTHTQYRHLPAFCLASTIFSSSSGQMSGQWVNPKYSRLQFPSSCLSVKGLPLWSTSWKGPPMAAAPTTLPAAAVCLAIFSCRSLLNHQNSPAPVAIVSARLV